ncbi:galactitol-1-phosphate 5-dehydrogenase [bacterium]
MKALILQNNTNLVYKNFSDPVMQEDECLISVKNAGICNSDIYRAYNNGAYFYPLIMGHEFSGEVIETGSLVTNFKKGGRIIAFPLLPCHKCAFCQKQEYAQCIKYDYYGSRRHGAFAEYICIKEWNLLKISDTVDFEEACVIEPIAVAMHVVKKLDVKGYEKAAVIGAGFLGLIIAHYLLNKLNKDSIYVIDRNMDKLSIIGKYGVNTVYTKEHKNWAEEIRDVDIVIEACGAVETFRDSLKLVKSHGTVLWAGNITGALLLEKSMVSSMLRKEITLKGVWNSSFTHKDNDDWHDSLHYLEKDNNIVKNLITHCIELKQGPDFFKTLFMRKSGQKNNFNQTYIKAVFKI